MHLLLLLTFLVMKMQLILYYIALYIHPSIASIHCSMGSSPVGVQCTLDYYFPHVSVLCLPFQNVYFLVTPFFYIVQPFPFWSSSFCFPFHLPEHHLFYQSAIFHSTDVSK